MTDASSDIIRCRRCLTLVYEGAATCHHCGEDLSAPPRRRVFTRKTWIFIVLVLMGWTGVDAAILFKERKSIHLSDAYAIGNCVRDIFQGRDRELRIDWNGRDDELERIRRIPESLGFTEKVRMDVDGVRSLGRRNHLDGFFDTEARSYAFTVRKWGVFRNAPVFHGRACVAQHSGRLLCLEIRKEPFSAIEDDWCSARRLVSIQGR